MTQPDEGPHLQHRGVTVTKSPLFSTYRQGENRVTSSMLAVFERIDLSLLEELLSAATGESALQMVAFSNQPSGEGVSTPDARISARFSYWFEVKTAHNALRGDQLRSHLEHLDLSDRDERLFIVTPDPVEPAVVQQLDDPRAVWFSFAELSDAIDHVLGTTVGVISERSQFLLRELQELLREDGLLDFDDVVVVAARNAYPEYLEQASYVCQPGRGFREGLSYLGFYTKGAIQPEVPRILHREDAVPFSTEEAERRRNGGPTDQRIAELIDELVSNGSRQPSESYQMFLLSPAEDAETLNLDGPVINDTLASSGRPWAWTLQQRYVSSSQLTSPGVRRTSDLTRAAARQPG
jgi:hypothetical protein